MKLSHRLWLLPLIVAMIVAGRSSLGHRPANPSTFAVSDDQLVNDLVLSSTYKLLYSIYSLRHEADTTELYPEMVPREVLSRVKASSPFNDDYLDETTLLRRVGHGTSGQQKNVVVIVEESLGARFVGSLGGLPLTPELDSLANEGIRFTRLYATGIRSARGLEAIVAGFPPSPARAVLKLGGAQHGFYTLARTLRRAGYRTHFVYGGEAHFDNMQGFFLNNGFQESIDVNDFENYRFKGTWGVSDEDLFDKLHDIAGHDRQPFFAVAFTSSFHSPYEFPENSIELYESPAQTKNNAVKYADHALGGYFDLAKASEYWQDTVFLVIADHDERPRGFSLVPVSSYHIPGVIVGGGIAPQVIDEVASQLDMIPTLLGLAGVTAIAPVLGNDLRDLPAGYPGRAVMQYGDNHAYMQGNQVVIHRPDLPAAQFLYEAGELRPTAATPELVQTGLAWALLPGILYRDSLYQMPDQNLVDTDVSTGE